MSTLTRHQRESAQVAGFADSKFAQPAGTDAYEARTSKNAENCVSHQPSPRATWASGYHAMVEQGRGMERRAPSSPNREESRHG